MEKTKVELPEGMTPEEFTKMYERYKKSEEIAEKEREAFIQEGIKEEDLDPTCWECAKKYGGAPDCVDPVHFGKDWVYGGCPRLESFMYQLLGEGEKAWKSYQYIYEEEE